MTTNITEAIQVNLKYPVLKKIDPANRENKQIDDRPIVEKLSQSAIPAVLAALYRYSQSEQGAVRITQPGNNADWLSLFFDDKLQEAIHAIANYAGVSENQAESHMENIADEAIRLLREGKAIGTSPEKLKNYMSDQRHNILVYLPASLGIGYLLQDDSLDDNTNKMEGPVSNFVHKIEDKLAGGGK